jgi:Transposase DDE domain.
MIAQTMGIVKLGQVALDGTKIKANASKHKALSWDHACKLELQIQAEVDALLRQAEAAEREEIPEGMNIPEELSRREKRLQTIDLAKQEIERRAAERYAKEQETYDQKRAARKAKKQESGKKPKGREPKPPEPGPKKTDQLNLTDEDSRIMPTAGGTFEQAYNAQAGVDLNTMLIVENHVTQQPNDQQEIENTLENLTSFPDPLGTVDTLVADAGYFSETNLNKCEAEQITPYIAVNREKHNISLEERFAQPGSLPEDADVLTRMKHRLKTPEGKKIYAKRKSTVEPVFGIIKAIMGFRQFSLRGLEAVSGEWNLVCMAFNLKRMYALAA